MNNPYNKLSLGNKILSIVIAVIVIFSIAGFSINIFHEVEYLEKKFLEEKVLVARIVGSYTAPDLAFENKESAIQSLSYLESDKSIINAHLFDNKEKHFVSLYKGTYVPDLNILSRKTKDLSNNKLIVREAIKINEELFGYLVLETSTNAYAETLENSIRGFVLIAFALLVIVILIAKPLAASVTAPITELANAAKLVTREHKYITTVKVKESNEDEVSDLVHAFNEMLLNIQLRESERDEANQSLKDNEELLRLMLHNMVIAVITIDENGTIITFNHAAEKIFGYSESDVIGASGIMLLPVKQQVRLQSEVNYYHKTGLLGVLANGIELHGINSHAEEFPVYLSVAEMINPKTERANFIISCEDITNKKLQEEQIKRTQRMDALGNLTGGVAHDYNNMLGVILGYTELLLMKTNLPESLQKYVVEISNAGERARKLTSKLLAFTKQTSVEAVAVNINDLLTNIENLVKRTLTLKIKLNFVFEKDLWNVWIDSSELEDAVVNISINAMHAMEKGGDLTFHTKNIVLSEIEANAVQLKAGEYVLLRITDSGKGMDEATRVRIFEPFFSTKKDKGTGLGLSQVYGFVKRARGEIKVYSEVGKGTHFDLYFPRYHSNITIAQNEQKQKDSSDYAGSECILVVDDEEGLRNLATELLSSYGYKIQSVESAEEALELLAKQSFDLMLSDVVMAGMDGFELASVVRKKYPNIKIQLASGFSDNWQNSEAVQDLKNDLLQKPYRKDELLERVRLLLDMK